MEKIHGVVRWTRQVTEDHWERSMSVFDISKDETMEKVIEKAKTLARDKPTELEFTIIVSRE